MTHSFRATLRLIAVAAFAVMIAVSVWLLFRPLGGRTADCATAQAMWTYYSSQVAADQSAALESGADNNQIAVKYQNMVNELQTYADRISTPDVRAKADTIVAINRDILQQWKRWAAESQLESSASTAPTRSDRQFGREFAANAKKLKIAHAELESVCPK